jgi:predicted HTH domain antitoxin
MGEVMVSRNQSLNNVIDLMRKSGLDEEGAVKRIINLGIQDYVADLYKDGEISIREAAEILQLNFRQTFEILQKKVGGNVEEEQEIKALKLAKKLAERS